MKRRSFFGFAAGAAVAGPAMAKEAAAKAAMSLSGGEAMLGLSSMAGPYYGGEAAGLSPQRSLLTRAASSVNMLRSITGEQRASLRRRFSDVHRLDADLASYHSLSLGARQEMQRERNIEAFLSNRRSWWQGILDRGDENYPQDPMDDI
jgi:hypothetical protein